MNLLFGFAPFLLFVILSRLSADLALWLAFASSFIVTVRDFVESPNLRLLDGASLALFGLLALGRGFFMPGLSLAAVRTIMEAGLCLVIFYSLFRGQPFSLQYASRDSIEPHWPLPDFLHVNRLISLSWGAGFAAMGLADGAVAFAAVPFYVGIAMNIIVLSFCISFTLRYPVLAARRLPR
jgi:hypothetical protein